MQVPIKAHLHEVAPLRALDLLSVATYCAPLYVALNILVRACCCNYITYLIVGRLNVKGLHGS